MSQGIKGFSEYMFFLISFISQTHHYYAVIRLCGTLLKYCYGHFQNNFFSLLC